MDSNKPTGDLHHLNINLINTNSHNNSDDDDDDIFDKYRKYKYWGAVWTLVFGCIVFLICLAAAIGKLSYAELRGPSIIGCDGWLLLSYGTDDNN